MMNKPLIAGVAHIAAIAAVLRTKTNFTPDLSPKMRFWQADAYKEIGVEIKTLTINRRYSLDASMFRFKGSITRRHSIFASLVLTRSIP